MNTVNAIIIHRNIGLDELDHLHLGMWALEDPKGYLESLSALEMGLQDASHPVRLKIILELHFQNKERPNNTDLTVSIDMISFPLH